MPEDETDNSNGKDIKQPESEPKVVTTIINSSFHTYIHTYHWFPQFLTLAMVTSNCYQLQTTKEAAKKDTTEKPEIASDPNSSQDFIINRKKKKIVTTTKRTTSARATKKRKMLTRAAAAAGQRKVSDYFLTESEESQVVTNFFFGSDDDDSNTLPDLVKNRSPSYIVIDSSSDEVPIVVCQVSGPKHVSSPVRHVCVCECPSLSPINAAPITTNRDECVIIADSTTT